MTQAPGQLLVKGVERVIELRYPAAQDFVERARARQPQATPAQIGALAIARAEKELMTLGAASGGSAAVPGAGTAVAIGAIGADLIASGARLTEMTMRIAVAYEHPMEDLEARRAVVLTIMLGGVGGQKVVNKAAAELGKGLSSQALKHISGQQLRVINRFLGRTIITKYGTKRGVISLGRALPFGVGAVIGAGGNYLVARSTGRYAIRFFDEGDWSADPGEDVIDVDEAGLDDESESRDAD
ncbi:MAG: hypothetical protein ACKVWR_22635 [Acidimicrobiales bacterium]